MVKELSGKIILYLSQFLEIELGAIYVFDEVAGHLELMASAGLNVDEVKQVVKPGEGVIGNTAKNKSLQIIDTKDKFQKVYSASGEIYPEKLYLLPLHFDGKILAVIELASVNSLSELKIEFLELIKERVSVNIDASVARYRNKELLDKSLEQAEILRSRDQDLKREKALMDSLLNNLPDAVYFKDRESKFIKVSKSMPELFNVEKQEDLYGKSDFDFFGKEHAMQAYDDEQEIIKTKIPIIGKIETETYKDGSIRYVSSTKLPLLNEDGEVMGTFGISRDVTKIKELELEINERNKKLNTQKEELKLINEQLKSNQEELRATNEELHAQEEELRVANEELAEQTKILTESEKNLQVQQEELQVANEELEAKTNLLELQKNEILDKNKKLTKTQNELEQKAKELELASQYKSEFLANMSHELRTPLNSMLILSKLLRDNKNNNLTEDQLKSVSIIYNSGKDLLDLINEILDLSKIEAGKMTYDFNEVIPDEIINDIKTNFTPVAENKDLSLDIQKSDDFPNQIFTDRQRLMQVLKNLLSNAFKFTSKGGVTLKMGIPEEEVKLVNPELNKGNACYIAVKDTGVGIPQGKVEAIFEAFQQADGGISRKFGGTGLGLSISKQLTHMLGGEIHVTSKEGVGSVFTVYLPTDEKLVGKEQVGILANNDKEKSILAEDKKPQKQTEKKEKPIPVQLPVFVDDDRNSALDRIRVLIIHEEREKAKMLIDLCHSKKFNAVAAAGVSDGIILAEKYIPQAIIISAELNDPTEVSKLNDNRFTARIPLHIVSRIDDSLFDDIQELQTPETKEFQNGTKNIENKIGREFKQVLVVEDDPATRLAIQQLFENKNIIIHEAKTAGQAYEMISAQPFDCIILDLGLPDFSGTELLDKLNANKIPMPYVIINTARELSAKELRKLQKYSDSIVIKGVKSDERLIDEVTLFLHQVSNTLPRKAQLGADENTGFKGKKVLIVDDDIRNVFAMAQILEEREIEIMEAENGEVAIEVLKNNKDIDLVLLDIMMPVMNGYEAMKIIRKTPGIEHIPIITLTAKAMKEDYQKAIDFGANDFISKPVNINKLLSLLKIWLFK